jgi:hypothetical protein
MSQQTYEKYYGDKTIQANEAGFFELNFHHEAQIKKLIVRQTSGGSVPYSVDLLNSADAEGLTASQQSTYRVMPTRQANAGDAMELFSTEGYAFKNRDGNPTNPGRKIYVQIIPAGNAGATIWEITIAGVPGSPG